MFGAGGQEERPTTDDDIIAIDGNWTDVPDAIADCSFLAFNSPGPPVGYDANPIILLEAMMNAKTFVAQSGIAFVRELADVGLVVDTDEQWVEAARTLWLNPQRRAELERKSAEAYRARYNLTAMMDGLEEVIMRVRRSG
jgi:glycosyltransferase involved in cell wall biosynthesis